GIAWGDAKQKLFERLDTELASARERYDALVARPQEIEDRLLAGAKKARERTRVFIEKLRWAVGVRKLTDRGGAAAAKPAREAAPLPQMKSYRESDGQFYFKLEADGVTLLQSRGFGSPKDAGRLSAALIEAGDDTTTLAPLLRDALPAENAAD